MTLRIASVPADHPYVAHLTPPGGPDDASVHVTRLPDPPVLDDDGVTHWWPPRMLDAAWVRAHADDFDLLHVHFGFESFTPAELTELVDALTETGKPLVVTVHDLRNPHLADASAHLDRLGVLVEAATELITLTPGAADEIARRWGRDAAVVPHPHVVPVETISAISSHPRTTERQRIGLHLKSFRRNVDAVGALRALEHVASERDVDVVVTMHAAVADPTDPGYDDVAVPLARRLHDAGLITLVLHEPMSDEDLFAHVGALDVSVIANVWGTHSGWIEMCHDLGTRVVAPRIGYYAEQHAPVLHDLAATSEAIDPRRLAEAVLHALDLPRPEPASVEDRTAERTGIAAAHAALYVRACATVSDDVVHSTSPASAKARSHPSIGQSPQRS